MNVGKVEKREQNVMEAHLLLPLHSDRTKSHR